MHTAPITPRPEFALVVGHPGHELRLFHWLELVRPVVYVLTDGSGSGVSRTASSIDLLTQTGCTVGPLMGRFTDEEIYRALLTGDVEAVSEATVLLADSLADNGVHSVVTDAIEYYNPTHDLCAIMTGLAVERALVVSGRAIACSSYSVTAAPSASGLTLELDDAALERKLAAARRFKGLDTEVDSLLARIGPESLRREVLEPVQDAVERPVLPARPFYEVRGEEQVATGRYRTVIRYAEHFAPFAEKLTAQVRAARTWPREVSTR